MSPVLLLCSAQVGKEEGGLGTPRGPPLSRVYLPAAGPRGRIRDNLRARCQAAPGIQEGRGEVLARAF